MLDQNMGLMLGLSLLNSRKDDDIWKRVLPVLMQSQQQNNSGYQNYDQNQMLSQPSQYGFGSSNLIPTNNGMRNSSFNVQVDTANGDIVSQIANSIGKFESGGKYGALGPMTQTGDRAHGKYQIMGANIPAWSKEILGRSVTPQEFINNPQLQDQIAQAKMRQYYQKYGTPADVASMWFSGRPANGNYSRDNLGTSVPQYIRNTVGML
jgi:hypothetical protein